MSLSLWASPLCHWLSSPCYIKLLQGLRYHKDHLITSLSLWASPLCHGLSSPCYIKLLQGLRYHKDRWITSQSLWASPLYQGLNPMPWTLFSLAHWIVKRCVKDYWSHQDFLLQMACLDEPVHVEQNLWLKGDYQIAEIKKLPNLISLACCQLWHYWLLLFIRFKCNKFILFIFVALPRRG